VVLFVGRLQGRKRIDNLLYACAALLPELQPEVWIVGDGPAMAEFQTLAQQIYPHAHFPGAKRGAELNSFFSTADLFVLPGTGGLAVQEAMAYGLPVIVAEGDGTQDDLVRPENGWRVPPGDADALVATLREALSDAPRLRLMGRESFRIVAEDANIEHMVSVFIQAINTVMRLKSPA
jgi:glycosyltransferase involved in cell wall biosynthesis